MYNDCVPIPTLSKYFNEIHFNFKTETLIYFTLRT